MEILRKLAVIAVLGTFAGCIRKADISIPPSEKKLVVVSFVSPQDSLIAATVRWSVSRYATPTTSANIGEVVTNATVLLNDGSQIISLPYDPLYQLYAVDVARMPIVENRTYTLTAKCEGREVSAVTTIPTGNFTTRILEPEFRTNRPNELDMTLKIEADDRPNEINYIAMFYRTMAASNSHTSQPWDSFYENSALFDTDEQTAKRIYGGSFDFLNYNHDTIVSLEFEITTVNCSKEFYLYNKSVNEGAFGGGPFSEPVSIYTNMNGGFGCFGGYTRKTERKIIR